MAGLERGAILSSLVILLLAFRFSAAMGPWSPKQTRRRLRKHKQQLFQTPKKGERRKGSHKHKNSYKHNEEEYPAYLSGFYGYYEETEHPQTWEVPTQHPTYYKYHNYDGHHHHEYYHDPYLNHAEHHQDDHFHDTYHPTYHPTYYPTYIDEPLVYAYSGKYSKGTKYGKSKGVPTKQQTAHKAHTGKKAKSVNHGPVYEIVYEDGYEETLMPRPHPQEATSHSFDDTHYHVPDDTHYHVHEATSHSFDDTHHHDGEDIETEPHHHHHHTHPGLGYGHMHEESSSDSNDEAHYPPTYYYPPTQRPVIYRPVDLCNSKSSKKGSKTSKKQKGAYYHYHEPMEIMQYDYDCLSLSKSKKAKSRKKSKSKGKGMQTFRPTPRPHFTPFPTFDAVPTLAPPPFGGVTPVPSSKSGNDTDAPTFDTEAPTDDGMNMGPPLPQPTEPIPVETMEPTMGGPMAVTVDLVPFGLLYDIDRARVPTIEEYEEARQVVEGYINEWFGRGYNGEPPAMSLFVTDSHVLTQGNTAYSLISGAFSDYTGTTQFRDDFTVPLPAELDMSLEMAFGQPYLQDLLDLLAQLPPENIISTTTNIRYAENSEVGPGRRRRRRAPSKFTLQKGILMVAAFGMLGILLYGGVRMWMESRRQSRIQKSGAFFGGDDIIMGNNYDGFLIAR